MRKEKAALKQILNDLDQEHFLCKKNNNALRDLYDDNRIFQSKLLSMITHDLKAPLKYLMISSRGIYRSGLDTDRGELLENMKLIHDFSFRIHRSIDQLSGYSKILLREEFEPRSSLDLALLMRTILTQFEEYLKSNSMSLTVDAEEVIVVNQNKQGLSVMLQLLTNSVILPIPSKSIHVSISEDDSSVVIHIRFFSGDIDEHSFQMSKEVAEMIDVQLLADTEKLSVIIPKH